MVNWLGFNGAILVFFGFAIVSSLLIGLRKIKQFRAFDDCSETFLKELYSALEKLNLKEIESLCKKEGSTLALLTQELILIKDQFSQLNSLEQYLDSKKQDLQQGLEWIQVLAWLCPIFGSFAAIYEMSMLFTHTERVLERAELGPIAVAIHILICLGFVLLGLALSVAAFFLKHHFMTRSRKLIEELNHSGEEIISLLQEVKKA